MEIGINDPQYPCLGIRIYVTLVNGIRMINVRIPRLGADPPIEYSNVFNDNSKKEIDGFFELFEEGLKKQCCDCGKELNLMTSNCFYIGTKPVLQHFYRCLDCWNSVEWTLPNGVTRNQATWEFVNSFMKADQETYRRQFAPIDERPQNESCLPKPTTQEPTSSNKKEEEILCMVCQVEKPNTMVLPCEHMVVCLTCSEALERSPWSEKCIYCQQKISEVLK